MSQFDPSWAFPWRVLRSAALLACLLSSVSSVAAGAPLDEYASAWAEQYDVSGSWRLQRGDVVLAEGGRGSPGAGLPPFTSDTRSWIGSNSKQFAAVAVLRLVEQGRVELAAPLTRYLPELKPEAVTRGGSTCSVEHVLSHRCGLMRDAAGRGGGHLWDPAAEAELLDAVNAAPLRFDPGSDYEYSNVGYALIGLLVKRVSGQDYEAFLQEQLWTPLGMTHTGIRAQAGLQVARGQASVILGWVDSSRWLPIELGDILASAGAAGNIYSSARDVTTWMRALHHGQVLSRPAWAELTRPRGQDYALGLVVKNSPIGRLIFHDGSLSPHGLSSFAAYLPEHDLTAVVLANRPLEAGRAQAMASALLRKASGQPESAPSETALALRLKSAWPVLPFAVLPLIGVLAACMLVRRVRNPERFDRQNWWLSYHLYALLLAAPIASSSPLLLAAWAAALLAGVARSRFWQLPSWQQGPSLRPRLALALRSLLVLGLFVPSLFAAADLPSALAFLGLLLAELGLWLLLVRRRASSSRGSSSTALPARPAS